MKKRLKRTPGAKQRHQTGFQLTWSFKKKLNYHLLIFLKII